MERKKITGTTLGMILVIVLAAAFAAVFITLQFYEIINWKFFRKNQEQLDLRSRTITAAEYEELVWRMPKTNILWSVPFQGGSVSNDTSELTLSQLAKEDIPTLAYLPNLQTVHAEACSDYEALAQLFREYPDVQVLYNVPISGQKIASDAEAIQITSLTPQEAEWLDCLPNLRSIDGSSCRDFETMMQVAQSHPDWEVVYLTSLAGTRIQPDANTFEVTGAGYEELSIGLASMPDLKTVLIHEPAANAQELLKLREEYPDLEVHWDLEFFGTVYSDDAIELDLSGTPIESIARAKEIASKFPKLERLVVNSEGIEHEDMAAYRDEVRSSYKVVWIIHFTDKCSYPTDTREFMPIKQGEYYFEEKNVYPLRYCEDMVCVDIGHSTVATIDFVSYMPHLKYLILAWTQVQDISPISSCKELIYLEIDHGIVHDLSPLVGCTALEDINVNGQQVSNSVEPLKQMTWLKNLWVTDRSYTEKMELTEALPNTRVVLEDLGTNTGLGWRNLQNYYDMRDFLDMPYMD